MPRDDISSDWIQYRARWEDLTRGPLQQYVRRSQYKRRELGNCHRAYVRRNAAFTPDRYRRDFWVVFGSRYCMVNTENVEGGRNHCQ